MKLRIIFATVLLLSVVNVGVGFCTSASQPLVATQKAGIQPGSMSKDTEVLATAEKFVVDVESDSVLEEKSQEKKSSTYKKWLLIAGGVAVVAIIVGATCYFLYAEAVPKGVVENQTATVPVAVSLQGHTGPTDSVIHTEVVNPAPSLPVSAPPVVAANNSGGAVGECGICREPYTAENPRIFRQCIHPFHGECIDRWYAECERSRRPRTCPECRTVQQ